jgi:hypothetical protein
MAQPVTGYADEVRRLRAASPPLPRWAWLRRRAYPHHRRSQLVRIAIAVWNGITWGEWTADPAKGYTPPQWLTDDERAELARPARYGVSWSPRTGGAWPYAADGSHSHTLPEPELDDADDPPESSVTRYHR